MRVPGLHTSGLPARSVDRARGSLIAGTMGACAALAILAAGVLALGAGRAGSSDGRTSIALNALFGVSVLTIALLALQCIARRRYESALERTIRRQDRLLQEISAMSTMVELLQTCHSQAEANTVIQGALPKLLPGLGGALYVSRRDEAALE
ncbi:MAG TPA: hypothetical protein VFU61_04920, partial [Steroidobacteraceae bacterium]|nr:hypothetical protein [Steroidobacteraceae bacterium]